MWSLIQPIIKQHTQPFDAIIIGLSGGKDSVTLLHLLAQNYTQKPIQAIYINHRLHSQSNRWGTFCKKLCQILNVPYIQESIYLPKPSKEGAEKTARIGRYQALKHHAKKQNACVLTAHHLDDQHETFLLNYLRGSSVLGLSGMKTNTTHFGFTLIRPFLEINRQQISQYVKKHALKYIEDPTNQNTCIRRNYLRHQVLPVIEKMWPNYRKASAQSISHLQNDSRLIETLAELDCTQLHIQQFPKMLQIPLIHLKEMETIRRANCIRYIINQQHWPAPPRWAITQIFDQIIPKGGQIDWANIRTQTFQNMLLIYPKVHLPTFTQPILWQDRSCIDKIGILTENHAPTGIDPSLWAQKKRLTIRFKSPNQIFHLPQKKFKNLMQEKNIPPHLRSHTPIIYFDETPLAVSDIWINPAYIQKNGITLQWLWYYQQLN